jgi:starch-binding outer membrane protein, SusD/RagB family
MKISKQFLIVILLASMGCLFSCKKWLEKKPDTRLSTPETLADMQAMIDNRNYINTDITPSLPEVSSDDYFLLPATVSGIKEYRDAYTWQLYMLPPDNDWRWSYVPIYNMNICLDQIKKIPRTSSNAQQWDNVKGSALFIRSYFFLQLLWTFSKTYDATSAATDLGIALRLGADFNVPSQRASIQQCYDQVINDTKEAASYLPELGIHSMRPSKAGAYGLLARTYLSMGNYPNALKYAELCLQINKQLMDYNGDTDIPNGLAATLPFKKFNKETLFYTEMNRHHPIANPGFAKVDTMLYASYEPDDLRKTAFFRPDANSGYRVFKGNYAAESFLLFTGIATDEVYLIRAECMARAGNKDAAMADMNLLMLSRWKKGSYTAPVISNAEEALKFILKERRKELLFRGLRWMDIKRLNNEGHNITLTRILGDKTYSLTPNHNRYALPLPQEIVDMTGMPQNPK